MGTLKIRLFPFSPHQFSVFRGFAGGAAVVDHVQREDIAIEFRIESRFGGGSSEIPVSDLDRLPCRSTECRSRLKGGKPEPLILEADGPPIGSL